MNWKIMTASELDAGDFSDPNEPRIDRENACIEFPLSGGYFIDLDRCHSEAAIMEWVSHIADKDWITPLHMKKFIVLACAHHGIRLWRGV